VYKAITANKRNTVIIMLVFLLLIGGLAWLIGYLYDDYSTAGVILAVAAVYAVLQYFIASRLAMAVNGAHEISKKDNPLLYNTVENIAIAEGLPMPRVFLIDDPAPNAFATGRNPKNAMVAATTGLLSVMDKRELTAVMAHEMGHVRNYDILVSMIVFGLVSVISLISDLVLRMTLFGRGSNNDNKNGYVMLIGLIAVVLAPIVALLVQLAVSRQREYLADASAAMTTRDSEGMILALEKLKSAGRPMQRQNTSTAHLFFNNPLKKGFFSKIFSTHPPLEERITRLKKNAEKF
jgi:heat shock protein HtpX